MTALAPRHRRATQAVHLPRPRPREVEVLLASFRRSSVKAGADELGISAGTARNYLATLYARLGVTSQAQAVAWMDDHQPGWREA